MNKHNKDALRSEYQPGDLGEGIRGKYLKKVSIETIIRQMVDRIVRQFAPEQIILFGSHARGEQTADSDVDLLVVMPVRGSKREARLEIRAALRTFDFPKDVVISRPEEFEWRKNVIGTIEWPAAREGKVLYAKP